MGMSFSHMALLLAIVLIVFGAGKLPRVMGDIAKGLKAFKDGMKDGEDTDKVEKFPDDKNRAA
jgi:sec-independent protein translocase protein TatA